MFLSIEHIPDERACTQHRSVPPFQSGRKELYLVSEDSKKVFLHRAFRRFEDEISRSSQTAHEDDGFGTRVYDRLGELRTQRLPCQLERLKS